MDNKYIDGIKTTGFILENEIIQILKKEKWNIINSKYYEDDIADAPREMDILGYKVEKEKEILVYTVLLISCKKSENNIWGLISRPGKTSDPNHNYWPNTIWSNHKPILYQKGQKNFNENYYKFHEDQKTHNLMKLPDLEVFAFQELNKTTGKPQNDKAIFSSIQSLMKAQSYEMGLLAGRKKEKCVYQFNLISIVDSDLINFNIESNSKITQNSIQTEQFLSRYIIKREEQFFRIRFVKSDYFEEIIKEYNRLHLSNIKFYKEQISFFYKDVLYSYDKKQMIYEDFFFEISEYINKASKYKLNEENKIQYPYLAKYKRTLEIGMTEDKNINKLLNENQILLTKTKEALKKHFNYSGNFIFHSDDSLPF
ncbi:hypothetical protein [Sphingobacterium psychroaquaticum]|uniref:Uncharacterized protein n=1 Tax=Sphingobacterium psychroaquaticum TaxID=561061 RepID=A0A1X7JUZ0_9SPHI|nr:hypothetical protein [Sphingobacterium psychroaquaticum]SMG31914.1 hypothetical protein SAMN05660862_2221 [Sphingobacterium psychroaquaticum]